MLANKKLKLALFTVLLTMTFFAVSFLNKPSKESLQALAAKAEEEAAHSPGIEDLLSDEELKIRLIAARNGDMDAVEKLCSHYGSEMSDTPESRDDYEHWTKVLKDAARAGNPEAMKHFPNGNPD